MTPDCQNPLLVTISQDGTEVYRALADDGTHAEDELITWTTNVCLPTDDIPPGRHRYTGDITCPDGSTQSTTLLAATRAAAVHVLDASFDAITYEAGDTITLRLALDRSDLALTVDFSELDATYLPGAESVSALGRGRYDVSFTLSNDVADLSPSGVYRVRYTLSNAAGAPLLVKELPIRLAPNGLTRFAPMAGTSVLHALPARADGSWTLDEATWTGPNPAYTHPPPTLDFSDDPPSVADLDGEILELHFSTPAQDPPGESVTVELFEEGKDGYLLLDAPVVALNCTRTGCTATAHAVVNTSGIDAPAGTTFPIQVRLVTEDGDGAVNKTPPPTYEWPGNPPTAVFRGTVWVSDPNTCTPDLTGTASAFPFTTTASCTARTFAPRGVLVRAHDGCGLYRNATTADDGSFTVFIPSNCAGTDNARVEIYAYTGAAPGDIAVAYWNGASPVTDESDFTNAPSDYIVHGRTLASRLSMDEAMAPGGLDLGLIVLTPSPNDLVVEALRTTEALQAGLDYYTQIAGVQRGEFPRINAVLDRAVRTDAGSANGWAGQLLPGVHPGFMYAQNWTIDVQSGGRSYTYAGALAHELAHVFHRRFFQLGTKGYGSLWEPWAVTLGHITSAHAALMPAGWMFPLGASGFAENLDYNGKDPVDGAAENLTLPSFFRVWTSNSNVPSQGVIWRILYDLHDGPGAVAEPVNLFQTPLVPPVGPDFDQIDGRGESPNVAEHRLIHTAARMFGNPSVFTGVNPKWNTPGNIGGWSDRADVIDVLDAATCDGYLDNGTGDGVMHVMDDYGHDFKVLDGC